MQHSIRYRSFVVALAAGLAGLAAGAAVAGAAESTEGRIYGKVTTRGGDSFIGLLRWGDQEAFWGDHFNSAKKELPHLERFKEKGRRTNIEILGRAFGVRWGSGGRHFVARFGDIDRIEVLGHGEARLHMKDGSEIEVEGSADDVEATILVADAAVGDVKIPWRKIDSIDFQPTPAGVAAEGHRLHGTVTTVDREFVGYVQWDSQECLSTDVLDGENNDIEMEIEMGKIRSIARHNRRSAEVELKDGRRMILDGTNDVNDDIRGILVEDARFGRVKISWDEFRKVVFDDAGSSGPAYDYYEASGALRGTVTDADGKTHSGQIVFDLDEAYGWEMLDGDWDEISYTIPFSMIASITPRSPSSSTVVLRSGEELRLEDTQDVSDSNDGVLVLRGGGEKPVYLSWDEIERIDFGGELPLEAPE